MDAILDKNAFILIRTFFGMNTSLDVKDVCKVYFYTCIHWQSVETDATNHSQADLAQNTRGLNQVH